MASLSPSSTPPALTPDYTGSASPDSSSHADGVFKKARRQTAFYPNMNSSNKPVKPFSRSAAKRQSVMTLGSIEHLQYYFTKTGIAKSNPSKKLHCQLVPAIGGISTVKSAKASLGGLLEFDLPPSPAIPQVQQPLFPPFVKTYETDPEAFLPGVVEDLIAVADAWGFSSFNDDNSRRDPDRLSPHSSDAPGRHLDVLNMLKITTRAIRSVRNYVIALPDDSAGTLRTQYRNKVAATPPKPKRNAPLQKAPADPLSLIRKSALDVLAALRELEERSRVPLSDDAYDAQSDHGSFFLEQGAASLSRVASPAPLSDISHDHDHDHDLSIDPDMSISFVHVQGRHESVPVWEDEYDSNLSDEEREKREHWDDRLVLGGGWLYKQNMKLADLAKEKEVVRRYVDLVDDVLFGEVKEGKRGWEREREKAVKREKEGRGKGRRISTGDTDTFRAPSQQRPTARRVLSSSLLDSMRSITMMEENEEMASLSEGDSMDDEDLPDWAKHGSFADHPLDRAHALIHAFLPEHLGSLLPPANDKNAFLLALSSGQFLCIAYNTGVRWSRKPWGFILADSIHDIVALEAAEEEKEKSKTGWTFRRTDNLRLWAAALKIRYLLPIAVPSTPSQIDQTLKPSQSTPANSPSKMRFSSTEPSVAFDPRLVARKDEGWDTMLCETLLKWVDVVVDERRGKR